MFQKILHSGSNRDFREMQETETIDQVQSKDSLAVKKESSEGSGLLLSIDHNVTDAHTGYNVHREALNEAAVISVSIVLAIYFTNIQFPQVSYVDLC